MYALRFDINCLSIKQLITMETVSAATLTLLLCPLLAIGRPMNDTTSIHQVEAVVMQLFNAMRDGDSTNAHEVFHDDVRMSSTFFNKKTEVYQIIEGELSQFLTAIGTPHEEVWDERVSNLKIEVDDNLAHAWMNYSFYIDDKFSHCGVNAMQLVKTGGQWKILNLTDTRRRKACNPE